MNSNLVDFHCHLDLYQNLEDMINECEKRNIYTLAVTTTPRAWQKNRELTQNKKYVRPALGLHPQLVHEYHYEVDMLCDLIPETRYIGEIGMDGSANFKDNLELQAVILNKILKSCIVAGGKKILSIHSRGAASQVLNLLENNMGAGEPVLHWFSGNHINLRLAIFLGCWFSVGPSMFKNAKSIELIKKMPKDKVLTETDGPFAKNKTNQPLKPWDSITVIENLSLLWEMDIPSTKAQILSNLQNLLR